MSKQKEVRYVPAHEFRAVENPDGSRSVQGYAAVFNTLSVDMGGWKEMIAPGAFTRSLNSNPDVVCLRDHDNAILLGRTRSQTLKLTQDNVGLFFDCTLPKTTQAADLVVLIERKDIDGNSFSFSAKKDDSWKTDSSGQTVRALIDVDLFHSSGQTVRTLIDVDLFDVSIVSSPAYTDTTLSLRSAPKELRSLIESRKKTSKRDDGEMEDNSADDSMDDDSANDVTGCTCDCPECVDGDCTDCSMDDCSNPTCDCPASSEQFRSKAKAILTLAEHRS